MKVKISRQPVDCQYRVQSTYVEWYWRWYIGTYGQTWEWSSDV